MTLTFSILTIHLKESKKNVNDDLKILYKWLLANKITLNCDKTEVIFFHKPGERAPDLKIKMNGHRIYPSQSIKYLGIYLDETLNYSSHTKILSTKLKRANGMLCKARHYIPSDELRTLYYAIFSSHLIYGSQIWGQVTNSFNENIFKLQNRAVRIISFSDFRSDSYPIYRNLRILTLRDLIILQNVLFTHDSLKNVAPSCFNEYFSHSRNTHSYNTRNSTLGCLALSHNETIRYGINSIISKCITNWNAISKSFQVDLLTLSRQALKIKLSKFLLEQ